MIEGEYDDGQIFLSPVAFPMKEEYAGDDPDPPPSVTLRDEAELDAWAERRFYKHRIYDMEIPEGAVVKGDAQAAG